MDEQLLYQIGMTLLPGIGDINGKKLVAYCGGAEAVFLEKRQNLLKIPGIGIQTVETIMSQHVLKRAEEEVAFIEKHNITPLYYMSQDYPRRLKHCADSPMMLYYKGNADLNAKRVVGIVGTRHATEYGRSMTERLTEGLAIDNALIVSGLAYGIDTVAHQSALKYNLETIAVLGHGFQMIYPPENRRLAATILDHGGLLTENISGTQPDRENFPRRNRIVAGLADCLIVVESAVKGGAMITADIADSYDREVFAVPGKTNDVYSEGCNRLIKHNKANLIESADDIRYAMRWDVDTKTVARQMRLFREFNEDEQQIINVFGNDDMVHIDNIITNTGLPLTKIASLLLSLELDGVIAALPGKRYKKM